MHTCTAGMRARAHTHTHTHMYIRTYTHIHTRTYTHIYTHARTHARTHKHQHARVHTHTDAHSHANMIGQIAPNSHAIQSRWKQLRGVEYRDNLRHPEDEPAGRSSAEEQTRHKHDCQSAPTERDRAPTASERLNELRVRRNKNKVVREDSEESVGPLLEPWRPIGYHRGGCLSKSSPFVSPSAYPQAPWSVRGDDRWVLKPRKIVVVDEKSNPKWVPAGTHKLATQQMWSEDLHRFETKILRQWSTLE